MVLLTLGTQDSIFQGNVGSYLREQNHQKGAKMQKYEHIY